MSCLWTLAGKIKRKSFAWRAASLFDPAQSLLRRQAPAFCSSGQEYDRPNWASGDWCTEVWEARERISPMAGNASWVPKLFRWNGEKWSNKKGPKKKGKCGRHVVLWSFMRSICSLSTGSHAFLQANWQEMMLGARPPVSRSLGAFHRLQLCKHGKTGTRNRMRSKSSLQPDTFGIVSDNFVQKAVQNALSA